MQTERFLIEYGGEHVGLSGAVRHSGRHLITLLHGFGCTSECFGEIFDNTALDDMSILALDFPGHGDSGRLNDISLYNLQAFADMANAVIDLLSPEQVTFVGHSMGGAVSLIASQTRNDLYGLVDVDGNLVSQDCGIVSRETADQPLDQFLEHGYGDFLDFLRKSEDQAALKWATWYAKADPAALHELARSLVEWSDSGKLLDLLKSQKRVVYLHGDQDSKDYLLPVIDDIEIRAIAHSGHFMMVDNPTAFFQAVVDFMSAG